MSSTCPLETALLRVARALGCDTLDGARMVVGQVVDASRDVLLMKNGSAVFS